MDPVLRDKLLDLAVSILSIVLGGGFIVLFFEWRRHRRETQGWAREDRQLEIEIPRSEMAVVEWKIREEWPDKSKVEVYENKLEGTYRAITVVADFVIRNTTSGEIVLVEYDAMLTHLPPGDDEKRFYELETGDLISVSDVGPVKLRPNAVLDREVIIEAAFGKNRRLTTPPTTLVVSAHTSSGNTVTGTATLNVVPLLSGVTFYRDVLHPTRYANKFRQEGEVHEEDDIPF